ncbi:C40 family peptidase [Limnohabitans sp. 2KL-3]|uniref:C40 family peptidase n=1 Tax=Limnohabitans sp. 2KL-3 TaxID=1100700 RepID=UPI000AA7219F|nr:C40 family peptidase [Limnohabitans sp. 2KL-3]
MRWWIPLTVICLVSPVALSAPSDEEVQAALETGLVTQFGGQLSQAKDKASSKATGMVMQAMDLLGVPYKRGGSSESSGFDCSGFVRHLYEKSVGQLLPRRAEEQARSTEVIEREELKPGDLVFFNTMRRAFSHVGMYVGDGKFIHAPRAGKSVKIEDMRSAYWQKRFNGARRLPLDSEPTKP